MWTLWLAGCAGAERPEVLATIDGDPVTMADVEELAGTELGQLEHDFRLQRYQLVEAALDRVVRDRLLDEEAEARGISTEELVEAETGGIEPVTDEEITEWYNRNEASLGGRGLDELRPQIADYLDGTRRQQLVSQLAQRLRQDREVVFLLEPFRVELRNVGAPAQGPANAPVTLTEFSDFECPYCGRFFPTLQRLKEEYGDRLRVVFRQFPLNNHPNAYGAALASLCAHEQGRFWEMHDLMFAEQDRLEVESLKEKAGRLGLDRARFDACLDSAHYAEQVRQDVQEGNRVGVQGTPAIYVNGVPVPRGNAPYSVIAGMIDDELERTGSR
ncbi:MAG: thioredoxin domain-containing protein [Gemmatimonadetes bacterium]|nr:thioredoxin domain-containing protein [Gemmatimonadota bacterium]